MSISSLNFMLFFLPLTLVVFYAVPKSLTAVRNAWLTAASLLFYSACEPLYFFLLLVSVVFNWGFGLLVEKGRKTSKRNAAVIIGVTVNVLMLVFFKVVASDTVFFARFLIYGVDKAWLALPVGLSFYSFHAISYLVDINRQKASAAKNPLNTALYLSFFVKIVSGPLVPYADFERQLHESRNDLRGIIDGMWQFVFGLGKKVLLAAPLSSVSSAAFDAKGSITVTLAWTGVLAYFLQVFFDFSGYSDMATGLGKMFGFTIPQNFNYPYMAKSVAEYWRRWHITLGAWFKSYVFYPVSVSKPCLALNKSCRKRFGARAGRIISIALPLFAVWSLTGLWHNMSGTYLLWGLINGAFILWEAARRPLKNKKAETAFGHVYTVGLAFFSKILVRSETIGASWSYFKQLFGIGCAGFIDGTAIYQLREYGAVLIIGVLLCFPVSAYIKKAVDTKDSAPLTVAYQAACVVAAVAVSALSIAALLQNGASPFIYGKF